MLAVSKTFSGLDERESSVLEEYLTVLSAPTRSYIVTAGSKPAFFGIVCRGHLEAYAEDKRKVRSINVIHAYLWYQFREHTLDRTPFDRNNAHTKSCL